MRRPKTKTRHSSRIFPRDTYLTERNHEEDGRKVPLSRRVLCVLDVNAPCVHDADE